MHVVPLGASTGHDPELAKGTVGRVGQEGPAELAQTPVTDQTPASQEAFGVPVNPSEHTGVHVDPLTASAVQSPGAALATVGRPEQGRGEQDPALVHPELVHVAERVPENPALQTGVQVDPLSALVLQSPASAFSKTGREAHEVEVHFPEVDQRVSVHAAVREPVNPD